MTPRGIEILVKKASVDSEFKRHLLTERSGAAERIGLGLDPAEAAMLNVIPEGQLVNIIAETKVPSKLKPVFMGSTAMLMAAVLGVSTAGCYCCGATGNRPDEPYDYDEDDPYNEYDEDDPYLNVDTGARPDLPYIEDEPPEGASEEDGASAE
ncbi:MAG: hypothetical protein GY771_17510 [bacterium]|nr:hypothetical protein [bacterium]